MRIITIFTIDHSAMMISGKHDVEVISPSGSLSCKLPPLPREEYDCEHNCDISHYGHTHNGNLICGGTDDRFCFNLTSSGWKMSHRLLQRRSGHTSWSVDEGVMLMGGADSPRTTEIAKWDGSNVETFRLKYETLYLLL